MLLFPLFPLYFLNRSPPTKKLEHPLLCHGFCGSEVQAWPGWVLCSRSQSTALPVLARPHCHLWAQLGEETLPGLLQALAAPFSYWL